MKFNPHDAVYENPNSLKLECAALKDDLSKLSQAYDELLYAAANSIVYLEPPQEARR